MRLLVIDTIAPEGIAYLEERGFHVDQISSKLPEEQLYDRIADYEAIVTRSSTAVTAEFLAHARKLRILGRAGVGVDNIDVDACSRQGVVVANAPYGNVVSAAEHTVGMLLALVRRIPLANDSLKRGGWDRAIYGAELFRKTAGVLGLGKVGSRVATRLRAFEMNVLVYDPYIPEGRARDLGVRLTDLQSLLAESDVVTVDVARQLVAFRDGELVEHAVNIPVGDRETMAEQRPYISLGELLGRFCVQLEPENVERVEVVVAGQVARRDPELIGRAVLKGLLERVTAQAVNLVNAHLVARERGLHVSVETDEDAATGYTNLVTVTTQAGAGRKIIAGTVFDGVPRIVRMKDLDVEFIPEGHILVLSYGDRPGMVGKIGSILGRNNVNIRSEEHTS